MANNSTTARFMRATWRLLDRLRRGLHLLFLLLFGVFFVAMMAALIPETVVVPESAALVLVPEGTLVDQLSGDPLERALGELQGNGEQETLLKDLIDAVRHARDDDRIEALFLELDGMAASGLSKLQELADEIEAFRESGKLVVAASDTFGRDQYYLAAHADEVYMHPMGMVLVEGYSKFVPYYKSLLDMLYIDFEVWTAGEYKSFTEPYIRDDMSAEDREASQHYLNALWSSYTADVASQRGLGRDAMQEYANGYIELLAAADGDTARMALDFGLVDGLLSRQGVNDRMVEIVGPRPDQPDTFRSISHERYLRSFRTLDTLTVSDQEKVAVLTLAGTIYDGSESPGAIGGDSASRAIRSIENDENVAALVLRVDSPGGSAFASDVILDALKSFQEDERPLVISMGSVAASGGYWISMSADEIWASATTITGSIGVGAVLPTIPRTLDRIGIHVDGIGTTDLAGQFSPFRGIGDDARELYGQTVQSLYRQFIGEVAEHRGQSSEAIDLVARGRVWSGRDALDIGLVDQLGDLDDAIESAARLAGLGEGEYEVDFVQPELDFFERLAVEFASVTTPLFDAFNIETPWMREIAGLLEIASDPVEFINRWNDPRDLYTYCFCDVR